MLIGNRGASPSPLTSCDFARTTDLRVSVSARTTKAEQLGFTVAGHKKNRRRRPNKAEGQYYKRGLGHQIAVPIEFRLKTAMYITLCIFGKWRIVNSSRAV